MGMPVPSRGLGYPRGSGPRLTAIRGQAKIGPQAFGGMRMEESWDAGEMGCGRLVIELRRRVDALGPGDRLRVSARDPGAPRDLPAWCRMTGHRLVLAEPPVYVIQRRDD